MKEVRNYLLTLFGILGFLLIVHGCSIHIGRQCGDSFNCGDLKGEFQKEESFSEILQPGTTLVVKNYNGFIRVTGADDPTCRIHALITVRAEDDDRAWELGQDTTVLLNHTNNRLEIERTLPENTQCVNTSFDFTITTPRDSHLVLNSHNGNLTITNIAGTVDAESYNGKIVVSDIVGNVDYDSHNGQVTLHRIEGSVKGKTYNGTIEVIDVTGDLQCKTQNNPVTAQRIGGNAVLETYNGDIRTAGVAGNLDLKTQNNKIVAEQVVGDVRAQSYNGGIRIDYEPGAAPDPTIYLKTQNGSINLTPPAGLSARVELKTQNGSVDTAIPVQVSGKVEKNRLTGTIGSGDGSIFMETYNGSIHIK